MPGHVQGLPAQSAALEFQHRPNRRKNGTQLLPPTVKSQSYWTHRIGLLARIKWGSGNRLAALLLALLLGSGHAQGANDAYRLTSLPWYDLSDKFTVYARLSYTFDPSQESHNFNFLSPGLYYTASPWLQIWEGLINRYTDNQNKTDQLELRPYLGLKLFVPNDLKINFYNFTRYEYRAIEDLDTHNWQYHNRIRSRFGAEIPLTSRDRAWQTRTVYALVDVEPFYTFDEHAINPLNVSGGIGYVLNHHIHLEFSYYAHFERSNGGPLEFSENIFRLNVKIGLNREERAPGPAPSL
ncbi:MAG: hypothetical protein C5B50_19030 [Verrucomicrobia bacterium]|nr:MAG: hypothetical protein C5B50_19030 [Verrucomicrobiota bacterium]